MLPFDFDMMSRRLRREMRRVCFVTTPTSIVNRLMGVENFTDPLTFLSGACDAAYPLLPITATLTTLTLAPATHAGRFLVISSTAGLAVTPPAATGTGSIYTFVFSATISGGSFTLDAKAGNASDVFYGLANVNKVATPAVSQFGTAANSNLITANATTTGGMVGDFIQIVDIATHVWQVEIVSQGSGTIATPFSNH